MNAPEPPDDPALTDPGLKEFALSAPEITILSDHAARGSLNLSDSPDRLELRSRLAGIYDILRHRNTRCPVAIGLYGDWGSGKTSAMHWLETRLREWNRLTDPQRTEPGALPGMLAHPRVHPVWFDPWKYHTREDVWRGIIAEVILALLNRPLFTGPRKLTALKFAARRFTSFLGSAFLTALSHVGVKAGAGDAGAELSGEVFSDLYKEWKDYRQPEKAFLNEFEAALLSFINECIPHSKVDDHIHYDERICLFIDDLDRCLPDVTLEVLEALKLYLNIPALVFVVGLDQHVVQAVVTQHYEKHGVHAIKARDYLAKLFQVELPIAPSAFQMDGFLTNQLAALNTATGGYWDRHLTGQHKERILQALSELTRSNPREIKRLLNSSLLFARALSEDTVLTTGPDALLKEEIFPSALAFFLIRRLIQLRYPSIEGRFETDDEEHLWLENASKLCRQDGWDLVLAKARAEKPEAHENEPLWLLGWGLLYRDRPSDEKGPLVSPFFTDALLWELLVIPFHLRIAQRAPAAPESKPATPGLDLNALPPKVLEAILSATGETSTAFDPAKLTGIKKLVLTDAGLTDAHIPLLARCTALEELELRDNPLSEAGLKPLTSIPLRSLVLGGLKDVDTRPLTDFAALQDLSIESCAGFCAVDFLPASLLTFEILDCPRLTEVDHLPDGLRELTLIGCANLNAADHLPATLKYCDLSSCTKLTAVDNLPEGLEQLHLNACTGLSAVDHLPASLTLLSVNDCPGLTLVDDLPASLTELSLAGCTGLSAVDQLPASLTRLYLDNCTGLSAVDQLPASLTRLSLNGCTGLRAVDQLPASLTRLSLDGCTGLAAAAVEKLKASRKWEYFNGPEGISR